MSRLRELPDDEERAVHADLQRLVDDWHAEHGKKKGGLRAIGVELGFPEKSAQAQVSAALEKRLGLGMATRVYAHLGLTRGEYLRARGLVLPAPNAARVLRIAAALKLSAAEAVAVSEDLDALGVEVSDEEIAARLAMPRGLPMLPPAEELAASTQDAIRDLVSLAVQQAPPEGTEQPARRRGRRRTV